MKLIRFCASFFTLVLTFWLVSCTSKESKTSNSDEFDKAKESLDQQISGIVYNIPSPKEIPWLLQSTGAEFNQSLINDRNKADQYIKTDVAALNLGVYAADIGYLISYEKTQEAIEYINACKGLADKLGVIGTIELDLLQNFEENISNKDSLGNILDGAIKKTELYLKDEGRQKLAALLVTGSFIEGLYVSTGLVKSYPANILPNDKRNLILTPLIRVILDQEKSVDELVKMLGSLEKVDLVTSIISDLQSLQTSYRALDIDDKIKNNLGGEVLSDKNLLDITNIVEKVRNSITNTQ